MTLVMQFLADTLAATIARLLSDVDGATDSPMVSTGSSSSTCDTASAKTSDVAQSEDVKCGNYDTNFAGRDIHIDRHMGHAHDARAIHYPISAVIARRRPTSEIQNGGL
jgi:hypothetical protein